MKNIFLILIAVMLSAAGLISHASNSSRFESESFSVDQSGKAAIPVRITSLMVEAPPRYIDFQMGAAASFNSESDGMPINGPFDLDTYSNVALQSTSDGNNEDALMLDLDTVGKGFADTRLYVGLPASFSDMLAKSIDFHSATIVAGTRSLKFSQALGIGDSTAWLFSQMGCSTPGFSNGAAKISCQSDGSLALSKKLDSINIAEMPWVRFSYDLPIQAGAEIQINAKVERGGLALPLILESKPNRCWGHCQVQINLLDMLQAADPSSKDASLKELYIHVVRNDGKKTANNFEWRLGSLEFYRLESVDAGSAKRRILVPALTGQKVDLAQAVMKHLPEANVLTVLNGRLTGMRIAASHGVRFFSNLKEQIPLQFVGEQYFLDALNSKELSQVLDQKVFLEKKLLWDSNKARVLAGSGADVGASPSFQQDTKIEGPAWMRVHFSEQSGCHSPYIMVVSGLDKEGNGYETESVLTADQAQRLKPGRIKNVVIRSTCSVAEVEISTFSKSSVYRPESSNAYYRLPDAHPLFAAEPMDFDFDLATAGNIDVIKSFPLDAFVNGSGLIRYDLDANERVFYLRVSGDLAGGQPFERLFPVSGAGFIRLPALRLRRIDIVADKGASGHIKLNRLEILALGALPSGHVLLEDSAEGWGKLDAGLSSHEALWGGREALLPEVSLQAGEHELLASSPGGVKLEIDQIALNKSLKQPASGAGQISSSRLIRTLSWLLVVGVLLYLGLRSHLKWVQGFDRFLSTSRVFWATQSFILLSAVIFFHLSAYAQSWSGALLLLAYGIAVRYRIRPFLVRRGVFFAERLSAPYFLLFLLLLIYCVLALSLRSVGLVDVAGTFGYFLLVTGIVIEFIHFSREVQPVYKADS